MSVSAVCKPSSNNRWKACQARLLSGRSAFNSSPNQKASSPTRCFSNEGDQLGIVAVQVVCQLDRTRSACRRCITVEEDAHLVVARRPSEVVRSTKGTGILSELLEGLAGDVRRLKLAVHLTRDVYHQADSRWVTAWRKAPSRVCQPSISANADRLLTCTARLLCQSVTRPRRWRRGRRSRCRDAGGTHSGMKRSAHLPTSYLKVLQRYTALAARLRQTACGQDATGF